MPTSSAPVRVVFLTSIRDVGADDRNGQIVPTDNGPEYMEGVIHRTLVESCSGGSLHGLVQVAGIITDDRQKDLVGTGYRATPDPCERWIFPHDLECDDQGNRAVTLVENIPSEFRLVPKADTALRSEAKRAYEEKIIKSMGAVGADILVSDHYMAKIEHLINGEFGLYGRVLNIHPAVTKPECPFCFRGYTPTSDALKMARSGRVTRTGATLHLVNEEFDAGPIIEWAAPTPVYPSDTPEALRYRNYQMAKLPVFVRGLQKYLTEWLPRL